MNQALKNVSHILPLQKCIAGEDVKNLSDQELLAILLGVGTAKLDVMDMSSKALKMSGGLSGIFDSGIRELSKCPGIGIRKAIKIHAAFEMGKRVITNRNDLKYIDSPGDVWKYLLPIIGGATQEEFRVLIVDSKNQLLKNSFIAKGSVSDVSVHPREVFRDAIRENGSGIIVAHNHPTGVLAPSIDDIVITRRIFEAGEIIGIPLLDHIIISNTAYLSLRQAGHIKDTE